MSTNAMIPLMGRPPQIETPLQSQNAIQQVVGEQLENQQRQQVIDSQQIDLQQKRQMLDDSNTFRNALASNGGDWQKALNDVDGKVGLPAWQAFYTQHLNNLKMVAGISKENLDSYKNALDRVHQVHTSASALSDEDYATQWPEIARSVNQVYSGLPADPSRPRPTPLNPDVMMPRDQFNSQDLGLQTQEQYLANEKNRREQVEATQKSGAAQVSLTGEVQKNTQQRLQNVASSLANATSQDDWDNRLNFYKQQGYEDAVLNQFPKQYSPEAAQAARNTAIGPVEQAKLQASLPDEKQAVADRVKQLGQADTPENRNAARVWYQGIKPQIQTTLQITGGGLAPNAATPPKTPNATAASAPGGFVSPTTGKTLNDVPANIRSEVQQVLEYRRADPSITQRGVVGQAINQWVADLDPQHDATTFPAKNKIVTEYTKSMGEGQIGAMNTALGHLNELYTAAQALPSAKNPLGNVPLLHWIANKVGAAVGDDAPTTYTNILHRVSPELTGAYIKGGGDAGERGSNQDDFALSKGQQQIVSNIAESATLLNSKLAPTRKNWQDTFRPYRDSDQFDNRFMTPDAKEILSRIGSQAPTAKNRAPAGPAQGFTRITASDGSQHDIPTDKLSLARERDPGLKVQQ